MADEQEQPQVRLNVQLPESQAGGVWANFAGVSHSEHEFTIDFMRLDYSRVGADNTIEGIVVARVAVSPLFVRQLIAALEENWAKYAEKAMPKEVYGDDADVREG